jgi:hypothetical protein
LLDASGFGDLNAAAKAADTFACAAVVYDLWRWKNAHDRPF